MDDDEEEEEHQPDPEMFPPLELTLLFYYDRKVLWKRRFPLLIDRPSTGTRSSVQALRQWRFVQWILYAYSIASPLCAVCGALPALDATATYCTLHVLMPFLHLPLPIGNPPRALGYGLID
jgi:hypothetical protein